MMFIPPWRFRAVQASQRLFVYLFGFGEGISHVLLKQKNVQLVGFLPLPGGRLGKENVDG